MIKLNEEQEQKRKNYHYQYVSCSVTPREKEIVHEAAKKENFKTISDFVRRIVFGHIRKQENPELFLTNGNDSANTILLEKIDKSVKELQNNQEKIMELEQTIETMKEGITDLKYMIQLSNHIEERKKIIGLLEKHTYLHKCTERIGINKRVSSHTFRRTLNTLRKRMGANREDRRILLCHKVSDVNFQCYVKLNYEDYIKLYDKWNPYKNLLG